MDPLLAAARQRRLDARAVVGRDARIAEVREQIETALGRHRAAVARTEQARLRFYGGLEALGLPAAPVIQAPVPRARPYEPVVVSVPS